MKEDYVIAETASSDIHLNDMGRDEMNLAEFPLAALADRTPRGCKTLVFEDQIWDRGQSQQVTRRLTISASDRYGLPTALDDEVILGLVQLSKAQRFASRCIPFSRYRLVNLLGWRDEGRSYTRLEESLKRWLGVTLYYENAWWDKSQKRWVDAHFHLLDNLVICRRLKRPNRRTKQSQPPLESSFTWNEVVFRSFQSGYLKKLDLELYRKLRSAAAKRIYRFLDKRFHFSSQWRYNLTRFACEHIGMSRSYDAAQLKRRLNPAIRELEDAGYLEPLPTSERFSRVCRGQWDVFFSRAAKPKQAGRANHGLTDLEKQLVDRGVTAAVATRLTHDFPNDRILAKIAVFDKLLGRRDRHISKNPAGYLVQSIREDYAMPATVNQPAVSQSRRLAGQRPPEAGNAKQSFAQSHLTGQEDKSIQDFLSQLSPDELLHLENDAMKAAPPFLLKAYDRAKTSASRMVVHEYRQCILERHLRNGQKMPVKKRA